MKKGKKPAERSREARELEALRAKTGDLEAKLVAAEERLLRWQAEMENRRKREAAESKYAYRGLVVELLPVLEALDLAELHADDGSAAASVAEGVRMTREMLHRALESHGLAEIETVGKPFDPDLHECVAFVEAEAGKENLVVEEVRRGYRLHDRVLRPSQVTVGRKAAEEAPGEPEKEQEDRDDG